MPIDASRLSVPLAFDELTDEELERSAALFEETRLLAGSSLIKEGDFSYRFFVVLDGEVDVNSTSIRSNASDQATSAVRSAY